MKLIILFGVLLVGASAFTHQKRDTAALIKNQFEDFKEGCFPRGSLKGCNCNTKNAAGAEVTVTFETPEECVKSVEVQTIENKANLNKEFKEKVGQLKENCFPRPGKGCRCTETDAAGDEVTKLYDTPEQCAKPVEVQTKKNKEEMNMDFKRRFGYLREDCFPRPIKGCRCTEKDAKGDEVTKLYDTEAECSIDGIAPASRVKRGQVLSSDNRPSQNVRDPVREKAEQNYAAVLNELKDKFAGLREGCYPRPKGCLCVTGKDHDGREITQRYMKDSDCKCVIGSNGCPKSAAAGA